MKPKSRKERLYWSRKLEMKLVEFVKERECIWRPIDNTNHNIQLKYKAYAEFASMLGGDFTARSVRDRWVNIRSTFNHNQRKIDRSKKSANSEAQIYVPSWPLWKACQFLSSAKRAPQFAGSESKTDIQADDELLPSFLDSTCDPTLETKVDTQLMDYASASNLNDNEYTVIPIRQRGTLRKRTRLKKKSKHSSSSKSKSCKRVLDDLVQVLRPICADSAPVETSNIKDFWYLGRHVCETLTRMRTLDADCATEKILEIIDKYTNR